MTHAITTFYYFSPLASEALPTLREDLLSAGRTLGVQGLVLIGTEGCNATVAALPEDLEQFKSRVKAATGFHEMLFKDSHAEFQPFRRFKVEIRDEIVSIKRDGALPFAEEYRHLSPDEFHQMLERDDVVVVDTRNRYETRIGKFRNAIDPQIDKFSQLPEFLERSGIPKDRTVLMYCTGGIRCEKAILSAEEAGFKNVYQLQGGILNYLEKIPNGGAFEGECFVFDNRVAVDAALAPSKRYKLCPHCGEPAEQVLKCTRCGSEAKVCERCRETPHRNSCSKNCAYHLRRLSSEVTAA